MSLGRQMLAAVGNLEPTGDDPAGEFLDGALAILTAALGKLPEAQREAALAHIERGVLRASADEYVARSSPFARLARGNGHAG